MASRKKSSKKKTTRTLVSIVLFSSIVLIMSSCLSAFHLVRANQLELVPLTIDPNFGIENRATALLIANRADALIPIIACESQFRHYEPDGSILKNKEGSSAIGVAQIIASLHPDPRIIQQYNYLKKTDFTVDDFNIHSFEGNIGYALVLFTVRGVRDWECSER